MSKTPLNCLGCGTPIVGQPKPGMMREVTGWVKVRAAGGSNHVMDQTPTGQMLCTGCGALKRAGVNFQQTALFDADEYQ